MAKKSIYTVGELEDMDKLMDKRLLTELDEQCRMINSADSLMDLRTNRQSEAYEWLWKINFSYPDVAVNDYAILDRIIGTSIYRKQMAITLSSAKERVDHPANA